MSDSRLGSRLLIFFFLTYLFFYAGHFSSIDEVHVYETMKSLVEEGNLAIPPMLNARQGRDGHYYSKYTLGQSVLAVPFYLTGKAASEILPDPLVVALAGVHLRDQEVRWGGTIEIFFTGLYSPFIASLLMLAFFFLQREIGVGARAAFIATLLVGISSYVFGLSIHFLRHGSQALAVIACLIFLTRFRREGRRRSILLAGLAAAVALQCRIDSLLVVPGLLGSAIVLVRQTPARPSASHQFNDFLAFVGPIAVSLLGGLGLHYWKWGLDPMNDGQNLLAGSPWQALFGFFLSPGASVFIYSPLLLAAVLPWRIFWRSDRWLSGTLAAVSLPFPLLYSFYPQWHGLWSAPGPRYLFLPILLALVPLGSWLETSLPRAARLGIAILATLGAGLQIVLICVNFPYTYLSLGLPEAGLDKSLFMASKSMPVLLTRNFLHGQFWDLWLLNIWRGGPDVPAQPTIALLLAICWLLGWVLAVERLWQGLKLVSGPPSEILGTGRKLSGLGHTLDVEQEGDDDDSEQYQ